MLLAAEFGSGQVLWSIFWFFLFFMWIWLVITVFADIIRSDDLSGWAKALWSVFIIFVPYLGVFLYLIVRGHKMSENAAKAAQQQEAAMRAYIQDAASSGGVADELAKLAELHANGTLDDEEYANAKSRAPRRLIDRGSSAAAHGVGPGHARAEQVDRVALTEHESVQPRAGGEG